MKPVVDSELQDAGMCELPGILDTSERAVGSATADAGLPPENRARADNTFPTADTRAAKNAQDIAHGSGLLRAAAPDRVVAALPSLRVLLLAAGLVAVATAALFGIYRGLSTPHDQFDLRIYFSAMHWWLDGNPLYDYGTYDPVMGVLGFTYPPFAALLMSPMGLLGWRTVQMLAVAAIVAGAAVTVHLVLAERVRIPARRLLPVVGAATGAAFLLLPIRQTLQFGQINLLLAVLVLADVLVLTRRGSRFAGVGVGLAMAIKIVPGIFLVYLVLARKWRAAITGAATCAAGWLLAGVAAPSASWNYFTSLLWDTRRVGILASPSNQSVDGLLARIVAPAQPGTLLFLGAVVAVTVPAAWRIRKAVTHGDTLAAVTITGLLGVLLSPVSWLHHCIWVLPALVIIGHRVALDGVRLLPEVLRAGVGATLRHAANRAVLVRAAGALALGLSGLAVFVPDTRTLLDLPSQHLADLSPAMIVGLSFQVIWMLAAVYALPLLAARPTQPTHSGQTVQARSVSGQAAQVAQAAQAAQSATPDGMAPQSSRSTPSPAGGAAGQNA